MVPTQTTRPIQPVRPVGLNWEGRWGCWADGAVHVLAGCVGELEVTPAKGTTNIVDSALHEFSRELCAEIPPGVAVNFHYLCESIGRNFKIRVALNCDAADCRRLQRAWQHRTICGGLATVQWVSFADTASRKHAASVEELLDMSLSADGFALRLPVRWTGIPAPTDPKQLAVAVTAGNHWWDFTSLFGDVISAELRFCPKTPKTARLLVHFAEPAGARAIADTLIERYLYNPGKHDVDDTYPVACSIAPIQSLREGHFLPLRLQASAQIRSVASAGSGSDNGYVLRLCSTPSGAKVAPSMIPVTPEKPTLVVGREGCDVVIRRAHVSKAHATLKLRQASGNRPPGWALLIMDTSQNGTWVNGKKIETRTHSELQRGDRVSFLPEGHAAYADSLIYEVGLPGDSFPLNAATPSVNQAAAVTISGAASATRRRSFGSNSTASGNSSGSRKRNRATGPHLVQPVSAPPHFGGMVDLEDEGTAASRGKQARQAVVKSSPPSNGKKTHRAATTSAIALDADAAEAAAAPSTTNDIMMWLRSLDGGSLVQYSDQLIAMFENVQQIRDLYDERTLQEFYDDILVTNSNHRLAFASAIRALNRAT